MTRKESRRVRHGPTFNTVGTLQAPQKDAPGGVSRITALLMELRARVKSAPGPNDPPSAGVTSVTSPVSRMNKEQPRSQFRNRKRKYGGTLRGGKKGVR